MDESSAGDPIPKLRCLGSLFLRTTFREVVQSAQPNVLVYFPYHLGILLAVRSSKPDSPLTQATLCVVHQFRVGCVLTRSIFLFFLLQRDKPDSPLVKSLSVFFISFGLWLGVDA